MFEVTCEEPQLVDATRQRAVHLLSGIVADHAALVQADVTRRKRYLQSQYETSPSDQRLLQIDLQRADELIDSMHEAMQQSEARATACLDALLQLLDGPAVAVELAPRHLAVRLAPEQVQGRNLRAIVVPDGVRRRRVQLQNLNRITDRGSLQHAMPRCYGERGHSYFAWCLNRLDFRSVILVVIAYLRNN